VFSAETFDIDLAQLKRSFLNYQQRVHPDTYTQRADMEKKLAETQSSWINHAYRTLRDPLSRAEYMLRLEGHEVASESIHEDQELLTIVLNTREAIEEAQTRQDIETLQHENQQRMQETLQKLSDAFRVHDYGQAKVLTTRLRYWNGVKNALREAEDNLAL
jgi:molecular chaperone HscB